MTASFYKDKFRNEFQCPMEFVNHVSHLFESVRKAYLTSEAEGNEAWNILGEMYSDYCTQTGLVFGADNRKLRPGYFSSCNIERRSRR